ncbi:glycerol-3-phosphate dehydrogenase/oxidase [Virgibacillus sp. C22-A2]|uniref:Glycerol-3-phosphate dehydrogenase n=1 Tax=Virgibacillus tibetensis TaxID=3042313 RepID=A0ABU6KJV3_9BACI|nr:glycerol-3-phosphate dehydrogenase/oxidase [Virgibacillus sp. C22-A2]
MSRFSSYRRNDILHKLENKQVELLVIGGGITGAGIALDAVTRGMNTALVEMQDFAAGTSSRSTKLVHGGLRYLKQFEIKMVAEVGKERAVVYENGPHVTTPEWMMLPFHKGGTFGPLMTNLGLRVYDFLAGVKKGERRTMFSSEEALKKEPLIKKENLRGAGFYVEYKTDDARLTIEVLKKAAEKGAYAVNYTKAVEFIYDKSGIISGVIVEDQIDGSRRRIYAKKVINAGGPWVDEVREIDGSKKGKTLHLTKGVHLVFSKVVFPLQQAVYFDTKDGRMIFAIPRGTKTYVGTTDTTFKGDLEHPTMTEEDRDYLIDAINYMFPSLGITAAQVESSWTGLRPLIADDASDNPSEISRKDELFISDTGLLSMAGGKLTGYRKMAQQIVDKVSDQLKEEEGILYSESATEHLPISGGEVGGSKGFAAFIERKTAEGLELGIKEEEVHQLIQTYGANVDILFSLYQNRKVEAENEFMDPILFAELLYAMEYELAYKPTDFFVRRTSALFFDIEWVRTHQLKVINYMAKTLKWSETQIQDYEKELNQVMHDAITPVKA